MFSLVFSCQWGSESIAFNVSSEPVAFRVCTVQWVILRLYSSVSAVFRALAVHCHVMSCSPWMSSAPAQFLSFNIPSTTEGHLRTKYNVKLLFLNPVYFSKHKDTRFGTYLFLVHTHLANSRFSTGDLNFCVHSIPLWEPCVEKRVMLRASMHRPVGGALQWLY